MGTRAAERWIVVCDAGRARIFKQQGRASTFELVQELAHPESRAHVHELVTDNNGRKPVGAPLGGSYGGRSVSLGYGRVGAAPTTDPKEVEAEKFAREVSSILTRGFNDHAYEKVVLVAPPQFLGLLNGTIAKNVANAVEATVGKDLTSANERELPERIARLVAA